jgi:hypothetical protein
LTALQSRSTSKHAFALLCRSYTSYRTRPQSRQITPASRNLQDCSIWRRYTVELSDAPSVAWVASHIVHAGKSCCRRCRRRTGRQYEHEGGSMSMRETVPNKDTCGRGGERVGKSRAGLSWGSIVVTRCWPPSRTLQQPWKETRSLECVCEKAVVQRTKIACCN